MEINKKPVNTAFYEPLIFVDTIFVGMTGFEPATPSSRTKYATGLRYIPKEKTTKITSFIILSI